MNIKQAKQIPISQLLSQLGYAVHQEKGGEKWYLSPFRKETEASFKVSMTDKAFFDFGLGKGGTIIDFMMLYKQVSTVSQALEHIDALMGGVSLSATTRQPRLPTFDDTDTTTTHIQSNSNIESAQNTTIQLQKIHSLRHPALLQYVAERNISPKLATRFVQEAHYAVEGRPRAYFALALVNESGGIELKNPYFTGVLGQKNIVRVKRKSDVMGSEVAIFEGMFDALSYLMCEQTPNFACDLMVLNSVALTDHAVRLIRETGYHTVHLYCDHDPAGRVATKDFQQNLTERIVHDHASLYAGYKDMNEWWQQQSNKHLERM